MTSTHEPGYAVAIIGMAGRFPGADSVEGLWQKICDGADCLHTASDEELLEAGAAKWQIRHPDYIRVGGVLEGAAEFDAPFFGFSAHDAAMIDPQQRVFLECVWQTFEDAGYDPARAGAGVGVFAGGAVNGYRTHDIGPEVDSATHLQVIVGTERDFLATRVAYKLNLTGPAVTVQTACSTSLVAVQMACESLRSGSSTMAIAGGVCIMFPQKRGNIYQRGMILSPDGQCRAFDAKAAGTTLGRGAGAVLLKPLDAAVRDRDQIYAVIRGVAINNDGASKGGYTAPSVSGQSRAIRNAMKMAGFHPSTVRYVEAHGTGTEVGDSIEIAALKEAFDGALLPPGVCTVSSLKPNIGHLDAAAGVSNLIKATLAVRSRVLPGTRHFETPNPELGLEGSPFVVRRMMARYTDSAPFRAGVSSFGIGGTNVHVCIEEWLEGSNNAELPKPNIVANTQLFPLSANTEGALTAQREQLALHLETHPDQPLEDIAFTLQVGRRQFAHRSFALASDRTALIEELRSPSKLKTQSHTATTKDPEVYFLFPGQGAQYVNMGRGLYETDTVFRETIDECCSILEPLLHFDLRTVLFPALGQEEAATEKLRQANITMPSLVVMEYALAQKMLANGVRPAAMLGHSLGQYLAATISGVFELKDLLLLAVERGRLVKTMPTGSMLAVSLSEEDVLKQLPPDLSIAAINGAKQIIVSGPTETIQAFAASLAKQRVASQQLPTSHAFHSAMLDPILEKTAALVAQFKLSKPKIPFLSNLSGTWITDEEATSPAYWADHQRYTVRFSDNLEHLTANGSCVLIEVGPGETLIGFAKSASRSNKNIRLVSTTRRAVSQSTDMEHWLQSLGQLWLAGVTLDWDTLHGERRPHRTSLPTYPFERQHYWIDDEFGHSNSINTKNKGPLVKLDEIQDWIYARSWRSAPPRPRAIAPTPEQQPQHWAVFSDESQAILTPLLEELRREAVVTRITTGAVFAKTGERAYSIDPENPADYSELLKSLQNDGTWPDHLVYIVSSSSEHTRPQSAFEKLFHLAQALQQSGQTAGMALHILTERAFDVLDNGNCNPKHAAAASLADGLGTELPGVRRQLIDYDAAADAQTVAGQLLREMHSSSSDDVVAYRGRSRWVPEWTPFPLPPAEVGFSKLRTGGAYILTGGTGGIGLVLAEHLARTASAHLILVGRSGFPPNDQWTHLAEDKSTDAALRTKLKALLRIVEAGGTVDVQQADVRDTERMQQIVESARATRGGLAGIIHAAGVVDYTVVGLTDPAAVSRIFAAKAEGTAWITNAIAGGGLDLVLLCSSISAAIPSVGLCTYAAANAYLDAFAATHDDRTGTRVFSINWDNWSETGMAVDAAAMNKAKTEAGQEVELGITNLEGTKVFDLLLAAPVSQVAVSTRDLPRLIERARATTHEEYAPAQQLSTTGGDAAHPRPQLSQEYTAPSNDIEEAITAIWQDLLGLERVGIHDDFFELGGHSLLGAQVIARIRERFAISLPLRVIFDSPTPAAIAKLVAADLSQSVEETVGRQSEREREEIEI